MRAWIEGHMSDSRTTLHEEPARPLVPALATGEPPLPDVQPGDAGDAGDADAPSYRAVLVNRPFLALWVAQICSQLAQNLTWITLGTFVAIQTGKATLVSVTTVSAILAQLLFSGFAGVLVDRASKRGVLLGSDLLRIALTGVFIATTSLNVAPQTTAIIVLIFVANAVSQFFAPAEAATIPLLVEKRDLIVASSLFNITFNICQLLPVTLGVLLFSLIGIVPVLLLVAVLYALAAALVALLPARAAIIRPGPFGGSLKTTAVQVIGDIREGLRFLARDPGLRLTLFLMNVAPTFVFVFLPLGLIFVPQTFGLGADRAWILLLPAGAGLILGAAGMGLVATRFRKEALINAGLLTMGTAVTALGALALAAVVFFHRPATAPASHSFTLRAHHAAASAPNIGLIAVAMVLSLVIGVSMALSTIPAQTLVFERTSEEVRGRVLSMQQLVGGALPIIPLLTIPPLADIFGTAVVMAALGLIIIAVGAFSVRLDRPPRRAALVS